MTPPTASSPGSLMPEGLEDLTRSTGPTTAGAEGELARRLDRLRGEGEAGEEAGPF